MKYSYNWLKKLSGTKLSPEQLAELLTMRAFEVEGIEKVGGGLDNVVVGKILALEKHPNADKLQVVKVDIGKNAVEKYGAKIPPSPPLKKGEIWIVCGAWNIEVGDKVPVALVGAKLPGGLEIKEAEIRGVKSFGMLCAEDELGLGKDHGGILILDRDAKNGNEISKELELEDALINIDVLANRSHDALSHIGMAREICALEGRALKYDFPKKGSTFSGLRSNLSIKIQNKKLCPRYLGAIIEDARIENSPTWARSVLRKMGINPINNIVDVTNYVLLELGQPMHAFDLDRLAQKGGKVAIEVRNAKEGEEIKLLDGNTYKLSSADIVIADSEKAIALAGIMGGAETAITGETTKIVLESANFSATAIRKTRQRLNIMTDASIRFEKILDPNLAEAGILRALEILKNFPGKLEGLTDAYMTKVKPWKIKLDLAYVNKLLGENIPAKTVTKILKSFGLAVAGSGLQVTVTVPTFRIDLKTQEDLIEEIGRVYGYEKINSQAPKAALQSVRVNEARLFTRKVKEFLAGFGFSEVYNYSFYSRRDASLLQIEAVQHLELQTPMNPDQELMRVSLVPNLLKNVSENLKREKTLHIFEIGNVFWPSHETLPEEKNILTGVIVLDAKNEKRGIKNKAAEFYEAKGMADTLLKRLEIYDNFYVDFKAGAPDPLAKLWHEGRRAQIRIEATQDPIGLVGEINPTLLLSLGIRKRVAAFEFDLVELQKVSEAEREFAPLRKFPEVERDISLLAGAGVRVDDILQTIQEAGGDFVLDVDLFDIFDFADNTSSYSFRLIFGTDRTLRSEEVDVLMEKISLALGDELRVKIRK